MSHKERRHSSQHQRDNNLDSSSHSHSLSHYPSSSSNRQNNTYHHLSSHSHSHSHSHRPYSSSSSSFSSSREYYPPSSRYSHQDSLRSAHPSSPSSFSPPYTPTSHPSSVHLQQNGLSSHASPSSHSFNGSISRDAHDAPSSFRHYGDRSKSSGHHSQHLHGSLSSSSLGTTTRATSRHSHLRLHPADPRLRSTDSRSSTLERDGIRSTDHQKTTSLLNKSEIRRRDYEKQDKEEAEAEAHAEDLSSEDSDDILEGDELDSNGSLDEFVVPLNKEAPEEEDVDNQEEEEEDYDEDDDEDEDDECEVDEEGEDENEEEEEEEVERELREECRKKGYQQPQGRRRRGDVSSQLHFSPPSLLERSKRSKTAVRAPPSFFVTYYSSSPSQSSSRRERGLASPVRAQSSSISSEFPSSHLAAHRRSRNRTNRISSPSLVSRSTLTSSTATDSNQTLHQLVMQLSEQVRILTEKLENKNKKRRRESSYPSDSPSPHRRRTDNWSSGSSERNRRGRHRVRSRSINETREESRSGRRRSPGELNSRSRSASWDEIRRDKDFQDFNSPVAFDTSPFPLRSPARWRDARSRESESERGSEGDTRPEMDLYDTDSSFSLEEDREKENGQTDDEDFEVNRGSEYESEEEENPFPGFFSKSYFGVEPEDEVEDSDIDKDTITVHDEDFSDGDSPLPTADNELDEGGRGERDEERGRISRDRNRGLRNSEERNKSEDEGSGEGESEGKDEERDIRHPREEGLDPREDTLPSLSLPLITSDPEGHEVVRSRGLPNEFQALFSRGSVVAEYLRNLSSSSPSSLPSSSSSTFSEGLNTRTEDALDAEERESINFTLKKLQKEWEGCSRVDGKLAIDSKWANFITDFTSEKYESLKPFFQEEIEKSERELLQMRKYQEGIIQQLYYDGPPRPIKAMNGLRTIVYEICSLDHQVHLIRELETRDFSPPRPPSPPLSLCQLTKLRDRTERAPDDLAGWMVSDRDRSRKEGCRTPRDGGGKRRTEGRNHNDEVGGSGDQSEEEERRELVLRPSAKRSSSPKEEKSYQVLERPKYLVLTQPISVHINLLLEQQLQPHQKKGVEFIWENLVNKKRGCLLAHWMGLGKTFQVISFLQAYVTAFGVSSRFLVLTPVSCLRSWKAEFEKWLGAENNKKVNPYVSVRILTDTIGEGGDWWNEGGGVILTSHERFSKIQNIGIVRGPDIVVVDEAHKIQNPRNNITKALNSVETPLRLAVTGYPVQNRLLDYWSIVNWVNPDRITEVASVEDLPYIRGAKRENLSEQLFVSHFENPIKKGYSAAATLRERQKAEEKVDELFRLYRPVVQRLSVKYLYDKLPGIRKTEFSLSFKLSSTQLQLYRTFLDTDALEVSKSVFDDEEEMDLQQREVESLKEILEREVDYSLQRIPEVIGDSGKLAFLFHLVEFCKKKKESILIFSQYLASLYFINKLLSPSCKVRVIVGATPIGERQEEINRFKRYSARESVIFLISTGAGGLGLNLPEASRVVIFDASWNPCVEAQSAMRAFRLGQKRSVFIYRLHGYNTIEQKIYKRAREKEELAEVVLENDYSVSKPSFSVKEKRDLFQDPGNVIPNYQKLAGLTVLREDPLLKEFVQSKHSGLLIHIEEHVDIGLDKRYQVNDLEDEGLTPTEAETIARGRRITDSTKGKEKEVETDLLVYSEDEEEESLPPRPSRGKQQSEESWD